MSEQNQNEDQQYQTPIDAIAEDTPIEGEVAEQIVKQINSEGEGHPPIPEELQPAAPARHSDLSRAGRAHRRGPRKQRQAGR